MSANRWSSYDTDSYRLPAGMVRSGYDADSQTYFFRDSSGQEYKSASGSEYGRLEKGKWASAMTNLQPPTPMTDVCSRKYQPAGMAVLCCRARRGQTAPRACRAG